MKGICLLLCGLLLISGSGCTERTAPVSTQASVESSNEQTAVPETTIDALVDVSPLTQLSVGRALLSHVKEVSSVTVTQQKSGEVVYVSTDELLSQSFFDALRIRNEQLELPEESADYVVHFVSQMGIEQSCGLYLSLMNPDPVVVQWEDECWSLPQDESNWIRSRISGLV